RVDALNVANPAAAIAQSIAGGRAAAAERGEDAEAGDPYANHARLRRAEECRMQNAECRTKKVNLSSFYVLRSAFCIHRIHPPASTIAFSATTPLFARWPCSAESTARATRATRRCTSPTPGGGRVGGGRGGWCCAIAFRTAPCTTRWWWSSTPPTDR